MHNIAMTVLGVLLVFSPFALLALLILWWERRSMRKRNSEAWEKIEKKMEKVRTMHPQAEQMLYRMRGNVADVFIAPLAEEFSAINFEMLELTFSMTHARVERWDRSSTKLTDALDEFSETLDGAIKLFRHIQNIPDIAQMAKSVCALLVTEIDPMVFGLSAALDQRAMPPTIIEEEIRGVQRQFDAFRGRVNDQSPTVNWQALCVELSDFRDAVDTMTSRVSREFSIVLPAPERKHKPA